MKRIYESAEQLIGKTPLLRLYGYESLIGAKAEIVAKLEAFNPAGSAKDRVAKQMIAAAEKAGLLRTGSTIIEPTSGNTGIGLAYIGIKHGYRVIIVMPDSMSKERRALLSAYGAELVLTDGALGMKGAIKEAERLSREIENSFIPSQFDNPANSDAHRLTTGPEIFEDTEGEVDIFVSAVGTGGTLTGVGEYLKDRLPHVKVVAVEPKDSAVLSGGEAHPHKLQGIGAGFIPSILNTGIIDEVISVSTEEAYGAARALCKECGIGGGISSGAALFAAGKLAVRAENASKRIVVILPDGIDRYLSSDLLD